MNARFDHHFFEDWSLPKEDSMLFIGAKPHDPFDAATIIPRAVKEHDFAGRRKVLNVTLEIPLAQFAVLWLIEGYDAATTRIEVFAKPLNGPTFACGVATFKDDDVTLTGIVDRVLEFQ